MSEIREWGCLKLKSVMVSEKFDSQGVSEIKDRDGVRKFK